MFAGFTVGIREISIGGEGMRLEVNVRKENIVVVFLCIYFTSKLLWDIVIPHAIELASLLVLGIGIFLYFLKLAEDRSGIMLVYLYALFSLYILVNGICQDSAQQLGRAMYEYVFYTALCFACGYFIFDCDFRKCMHIVYWFGILIGILSWYEYFTKSYLIGSFTNMISFHGGDYGFRAAVFTRSYLSHGLVLGFFSLIAQYLFFSTGQRRYLIGCIFLYLSIWTTSSRGPMVAAAGALLICAVLDAHRKSQWLETRIVVMFALGLVAIFVLWLLTSTFQTGIGTIDYFLYRTRQIINWSGEGGNLARITIWERCMELFRSNRVFGIGPSKTGSWGTGSVAVTESGYLKHLCELGVLGFLMYYSFIAFILCRGISQYNRMSVNDKTDMILFFGLVVMVLADNLILQATEEIMVSFILFFGLGGLLAADAREKI